MNKENNLLNKDCIPIIRNLIDNRNIIDSLCKLRPKFIICIFIIDFFSGWMIVITGLIFSGYFDNKWIFKIKQKFNNELTIGIIFHIEISNIFFNVFNLFFYNIYSSIFYFINST